MTLPLGLELPSSSFLDEAAATYLEQGWVRLGKLAPPSLLDEMRARLDQMMLGELRYDGLFFQRDADSGSYDDLTYGKGWVGPTLRYRKVEKLELDPVFAGWIKAPVFREMTRRIVGEAISVYRATVFNKAADTGGSEIPWHQDGGNFWGVDRDPILQAWTAIDDAPLDGGCVEIVTGSHRRGLATPIGGVVPKNFLEEGRAEELAIPLPAEAGEVILIHNHAWHRSRRSGTGKPRRALTVCYMDAATRCMRKKRAPRSFYRAF